MSLWASQRKSYYVAGFILILAVVLGIFAISYITKEPTCFDLRQNADETGVDCGGSCVLLCKTDYVQPVVLWARYQKVTDGVYNLLAYIENPNTNAGVYRMPYTFQVYDKEGILLTEVRGETLISASREVAVFNGAVRTGTREPSKVIFSLDGLAVWERAIPGSIGIITTEKKVVPREGEARIEAVLRNTTLDAMTGIESIVIAYDEHDNAIAFSRTITDKLLGDESRKLVYTWPTGFSAQVVRIQIVSRILGKL